MSSVKKKLLRKHQDCGVAALPQHFVDVHIMSTYCNDCDSTFCSRTSLKRHNDSIHTMKKLVERISTEQHSKSNEFVCDFCPKTFFKELNELKSHLADHTELFPLQEDVDLFCESLPHVDKEPEITSEASDKTSILALSNKRKIEIFNEDTESSESEKDSFDVTENDDEVDIVKEAPSFTFGCDFCGRMFKSLYTAEVHMTQVHKKVELPTKAENARNCRHCKKKVHNLAKHYADVHCDLARHECDLCDKRYVTKDRLVQHKTAMHQGERVKIQKCTFVGCDKSYYDKFTLTKHMKKHDKTVKEYICKQCPYERVFSQLDSFNNHLAWHKGQFTLMEDEDSTNDEQRIDKDKNKEEEPEAPVAESMSIKIKDEPRSDDEYEVINMEPVCLLEVKAEPEEIPITTFEPTEEVPDCYIKHEPEIEIIDDVRLQQKPTTRVKRKKKLPKADVSLDSEFQLLTCSVCGRILSSKTMLDRHFALFHEKPLDHQCQNCPKTFELKFDLDRHIEQSHTLIFACDSCEKSFPTKQLLRKHIRIIHRKIFSYECAYCDQTFTLQARLNSHIKATHLNQDDCIVCGKPCPKGSRLENHFDLHHSTNPKDKEKFYCEKCGKYYVLIALHNMKVHKSF